MSNIYKALARNQFLQPVADAVNGYIEKKRQEKTFGELIDRINSLSKTQTVNETSNQPIDYQSQVGRGNANYNVFTGTDTPREFDNSAPIVPQQPNLMKQVTTTPQAGQPTPMQQITQQREVPLSSQEYNKNLMMEIVKAMGSVDPQKLSVLMNAFQQRTPKYGVKEVGNNLVSYDENNPSNVQEIYKGTPKQENMITKLGESIFSVDKNNPSSIKEIYKGEKKPEEITPYQEAQLKISRARLALDQDKADKTDAEKTASGQELYNGLMDSWGEMTDNKGKKVKAYFVTTPNGKILALNTDKDIRNYAMQEVMKRGIKGVNFWEHSKSGQDTGKKETPANNQNFIEGKIYIDGNGKKAKYVNGKFVEVN